MTKKAKNEKYSRWSYGQPVSKSMVQPSNVFLPFEKSHIEQSIPDRFEQQVCRFPDKMAVKTTQGALTYNQLNQLANQIAWMILALCGKGNEPIGLVFEQSFILIAAILGSLKAGKIYVPLDPFHPRQRNVSALLDSSAKYVLTNTLNVSYVNDLVPKENCVLNTDELSANLSTDNPCLSIQPDRLAYIYYTSGTTGEPKGIVDSHRNVLHNIMRYTNNLCISADDRLTLLQYSSFSGSVSSLFSALLNGSTSFPFSLQQDGSNYLAAWMDQEKITVYHSVPSIFRLIATGKYQYPSLRVIRLEGDQANPNDLRLYKRFFSDKCILVNGLGATECGIVRQYFVNKKTPIPDSIVPIGYAIEDMEVLLLDESGQQVGESRTGEIAIRSHFLAHGYWHKPELTNAKFLIDSTDDKKRTYRTGDLGRMMTDGCLEYLGRKNFNLKIRGNWVDVPKIEKVLDQLGAFRDVAVIIRKDHNLEPYIVAYLVPNVKPKIDTIRQYLFQWLPVEMIPAAFVFLDSIPINSFGKIDRRALPVPQTIRPELKAPYIEPQNCIQNQLKEIWEKVLNVRQIGIRDNFFDLGGDSLRALIMLDQVEQSTGINIQPQLLLTNTTIETLSDKLINKAKISEVPIVKINKNGSKRPFYYLHGDYMGYGFYCFGLGRQLGVEQPFYLLPPCGVNGYPVPISYEQMARIHLQVLRAEQPKGPYTIGGLCNGGLVAFEMARLLIADGEKVAALILINASAQNLRFRVSRSKERTFRILSIRFELRALGFLQRAWRFITSTRNGPPQRLRYILNNFTKLLMELSILIPDRRSKAKRRSMSNHKETINNIDRQSLRQRYLRIDREYIPSAYPGKVRLIWAIGDIESPNEAIHWWRQVAMKVDLHTIPGHNNISSLTQYSEDVAKVLKSCLP